MILPLKVTPKGGKNCILPFLVGDSVIKLKVSSPPEDGKANAAVLGLLSEVLKLPKSRLQLIQGEKARQKRVAVLELSHPEAESCLTSLAQAMQITVESAFQLSEQ